MLKSIHYKLCSFLYSLVVRLFFANLFAKVAYFVFHLLDFFYPVLSVGFLAVDQVGILFLKVFSFGRSILINKKRERNCLIFSFILVHLNTVTCLLTLYTRVLTNIIFKFSGLIYLSSV